MCSGLAGSALDLGSKGSLFKTHWIHYNASLSKTFYMLLRAVFHISVVRPKRATNKKKKLYSPEICYRDYPQVKDAVISTPPPPQKKKKNK